jgi:hypothetical protein
MHRSSKLLAALAALSIATGCGNSSAPGEADVTVSPVALAQALASDRDAALATYRDKVLELSGTVGKKVEPSGVNDTRGIAFAGIDPKLAFDANLSFVAFDADDPAAVSEFEALTVGAAVTLRCRLEVLNESGSLFLVKSCRVVPRA